MYLDRFFDERESIFFHHATCLPHGTGRDFCGATNPVGSTDAWGRNQCLKSGLVRGILPEDAWKFLQLCYLFRCDSVPNDTQPKRGVCNNECCSELVSEFSAPFTTEPIFLETIGCVSVKDAWHESFVAILKRCKFFLKEGRKRLCLNELVDVHAWKIVRSDKRGCHMEFLSISNIFIL